jgi:hypothetical protein
MVKFPLRVVPGQSLYSALFYGTISLICLVVLKRIYKQSGHNRYSLLGILLLCSMLAGWQVTDLVVLRYDRASACCFGPLMSPDFTEYDGIAWYAPRFQEGKGNCEINYTYERYYGSKWVAITLEINRKATWYPCGG